MLVFIQISYFFLPQLFFFFQHAIVIVGYKLKDYDLWSKTCSDFSFSLSSFSLCSLSCSKWHRVSNKHLLQLVTLTCNQYLHSPFSFQYSFLVSLRYSILFLKEIKVWSWFKYFSENYQVIQNVPLVVNLWIV